MQVHWQQSLSSRMDLLALVLGDLGLHEADTLGTVCALPTAGSSSSRSSSRNCGKGVYGRCTCCSIVPCMGLLVSTALSAS
jgi:hypothetical protein